MKRLAAGLVAAACLAGCGSSDKSSSTTTTPKTAAGGPAPATLAGAYTTTLTKKDLARNRAPELQEAPGWKLTISANRLTIANAKAGVLEASELAVNSDTIVLKQEECAAGGTTRFYDNVYRFSESGKILRFTKVRNSCSDRVAETVLTAGRWTKTGSG